MASSPEQEIPREIVDCAYKAFRKGHAVSNRPIQTGFWRDRYGVEAALAAVLSDLQRPLLEEIKRERETRKALAQIADRRKTERDTRPDLTTEEIEELLALRGPDSFFADDYATWKSARAKLERILDAAG